MLVHSNTFKSPPTRVWVKEKKQLIIDTISEYYGVDIFAGTRKREIVLARQVCMFMLVNYADMGVKEVGVLFKRDHSCVCHSKKLITDLRSVDKAFAREIDELENFFR